MSIGRSENMRRVKGKDTGPEMYIRKHLYRLGMRYRLYPKDLPGKPDLFILKHRVAIFVHGCFWHRHPGCEKATIPKTRRAFWEKKLEDNRIRDEKNLRALEEMGIPTLVIWTCELPKKEEEQRYFLNLIETIEDLGGKSRSFPTPPWDEERPYER